MPQCNEVQLNIISPPLPNLEEGECPLQVGDEGGGDYQSLIGNGLARTDLYHGQYD